jgi:hypothetical protein
MEYGIHATLPLNLVHRSPEAMVQSLESAVEDLLSGAQRPELLGVLGGIRFRPELCEGRHVP